MSRSTFRIRKEHPGHTIRPTGCQVRSLQWDEKQQGEVRRQAVSYCRTLSCSAFALLLRFSSSTPTTVPSALKSRMTPGCTSSDSTMEASSIRKYSALLSLSTFSLMRPPCFSIKKYRDHTLRRSRGVKDDMQNTISMFPNAHELMYSAVPFRFFPVGIINSPVHPFLGDFRSLSMSCAWVVRMYSIRACILYQIRVARKSK